MLLVWFSRSRALRDLVDYRGPHGVRIVHNGVLDYSGVWVGALGIGDATGGAVGHIGETVDNAKRIGKQMVEVKLDKLPQKSTDLYFTFSTPSHSSIYAYQDICIRIRDSEDPNHELMSLEVSQVDTSSEAIVACCMSRNQSSCWDVSSVGCEVKGNARDYRPILQCLRAIQEFKHQAQPEWPHQLPMLNKKPSILEGINLPGPPRLVGPAKLQAKYFKLDDEVEVEPVVEPPVARVRFS